MRCEQFTGRGALNAPPRQTMKHGVRCAAEPVDGGDNRIAIVRERVSSYTLAVETSEKRAVEMGSIDIQTMGYLDHRGSIGHFTTDHRSNACLAYNTVD